MSVIARYNSSEGSSKVYPGHTEPGKNTETEPKTEDGKKFDTLNLKKRSSEAIDADSEKPGIKRVKVDNDQSLYSYIHKLSSTTLQGHETGQLRPGPIFQSGNIEHQVDFSQSSFISGSGDITQVDGGTLEHSNDNFCITESGSNSHNISNSSLLSVSSFKQKPNKLGISNLFSWKRKHSKSVLETDVSDPDALSAPLIKDAKRRKTSHGKRKILAGKSLLPDRPKFSKRNRASVNPVFIVNEQCDKLLDKGPKDITNMQRSGYFKGDLFTSRSVLSDAHGEAGIQADSGNGQTEHCNTEIRQDPDSKQNITGEVSRSGMARQNISVRSLSTKDDVIQQLPLKLEGKMKGNKVTPAKNTENGPGSAMKKIKGLLGWSTDKKKTSSLPRRLTLNSTDDFDSFHKFTSSSSLDALEADHNGPHIVPKRNSVFQPLSKEEYTEVKVRLLPKTGYLNTSFTSDEEHSKLEQQRTIPSSSSLSFRSTVTSTSSLQSPASVETAFLSKSPSSVKSPQQGLPKFHTRSASMRLDNQKCTIPTHLEKTSRTRKLSGPSGTKTVGRESKICKTDNSSDQHTTVDDKPKVPAIPDESSLSLDDQCLMLTNDNVTDLSLSPKSVRKSQGAKIVKPVIRPYRNSTSSLEHSPSPERKISRIPSPQKTSPEKMISPERSGLKKPTIYSHSPTTRNQPIPCEGSIKGEKQTSASLKKDAVSKKPGGQSKNLSTQKLHTGRTVSGSNLSRVKKLNTYGSNTSLSSTTSNKSSVSTASRRSRNSPARALASPRSKPGYSSPRSKTQGAKVSKLTTSNVAKSSSSKLTTTPSLSSVSGKGTANVDKTNKGLGSPRNNNVSKSGRLAEPSSKVSEPKTKTGAKKVAKMKPVDKTLMHYNETTVSRPVERTSKPDIKPSRPASVSVHGPMPKKPTSSKPQLRTTPSRMSRSRLPGVAARSKVDIRVEGKGTGKPNESMAGCHGRMSTSTSKIAKPSWTRPSNGSNLPRAKSLEPELPNSKTGDMRQMKTLRKTRSDSANQSKQLKQVSGSSVPSVKNAKKMTQGPRLDTAQCEHNKTTESNIASDKMVDRTNEVHNNTVLDSDELLPCYSEKHTEMNTVSQVSDSSNRHNLINMSTKKAASVSQYEHYDKLVSHIDKPQQANDNRWESNLPVLHLPNVGKNGCDKHLKINKEQTSPEQSNISISASKINHGDSNAMRIHSGVGGNQGRDRLEKGLVPGDVALTKTSSGQNIASLQSGFVCNGDIGIEPSNAKSDVGNLNSSNTEVFYLNSEAKSMNDNLVDKFECNHQVFADQPSHELISLNPVKSEREQSCGNVKKIGHTEVVGRADATIDYENIYKEKVTAGVTVLNEECSGTQNTNEKAKWIMQSKLEKNGHKNAVNADGNNYNTHSPCRSVSSPCIQSEILNQSKLPIKYQTTTRLDRNLRRQTRTISLQEQIQKSNISQKADISSDEDEYISANDESFAAKTPIASLRGRTSKRDSMTVNPALSSRDNTSEGLSTSDTTCGREVAQLTAGGIERQLKGFREVYHSGPESESSSSVPVPDELSDKQYEGPWMIERSNTLSEIASISDYSEFDSESTAPFVVSRRYSEPHYEKEDDLMSTSRMSAPPGMEEWQTSNNDPNIHVTPVTSNSNTPFQTPAEEISQSKSAMERLYSNVQKPRQIIDPTKPSSKLGLYRGMRSASLPCIKETSVISRIQQLQMSTDTVFEEEDEDDEGYSQIIEESPVSRYSHPPTRKDERRVQKQYLSRQHKSDSQVIQNLPSSRIKRSYSLPTNSLVTRRETSFDADGSIKEYVRLIKVNEVKEDDEDIDDENDDETDVDFYIGDRRNTLAFGEPRVNLLGDGSTIGRHPNTYIQKDGHPLETHSSSLLDLQRKITLSLPSRESEVMNRLRAKREKMLSRGKSASELPVPRPNSTGFSSDDDLLDQDIIARVRSPSFREAQKKGIIDGSYHISTSPSQDAVTMPTGSPRAPGVEELMNSSTTPKSPSIFKRVFSRKSFKNKRQEKASSMIHVDSTPIDGHRIGDTTGPITHTPGKLTLRKTTSVPLHNELPAWASMHAFNDSESVLSAPNSPRRMRSATTGSLATHGRTISAEIKKQITDSLLHPPLPKLFLDTQRRVNNNNVSKFDRNKDDLESPTSPRTQFSLNSADSSPVCNPVMTQSCPFDSVDFSKSNTESVKETPKLKRLSSSSTCSDVSNSPSSPTTTSEMSSKSERTTPRRRKSSSVPLAELERMANIVRQEVEMATCGTTSGSSDSGIMQDSTHSSNESLKTTEDKEVVVKRQPSFSRNKERPKSDCNPTIIHTIFEDDAVQIRPGSQQARRPRPKSDLGGVGLISEAMRLYRQHNNEDSFQSLKKVKQCDKIKQDVGKETFNKMKSRRMSTPHPIKNRVERSPPQKSRNKKTTLVRSLSNPETLNTLGRRKKIGKHTISTLSVHAGELAVAQPRESTYSSSSNDSDSDSCSEEDIPTTFRGRSASEHSHNISCLHAVEEIFEDDQLTYAEALWDHVTMDPEELGFHAGDVIEVMDMSDKDWWWGVIEEREGWFPAAFVRLRANQEDIAEEIVEKIKSGEGMSCDTKRNGRRYSVSVLSRDQARTNVVNEIINAEREYVKHLKDVVEGYVKQGRKRPEMFSTERLALIFGNIEELYEFSSQFLQDLEQCYNPVIPHLSELGQCFLKYSDCFEIYSEYCNNHPSACEELKLVQKNKKYRHFFEACRLLQDMIMIPLEGFLLTPVQKICKYPLQLAELLKYTRTEHRDYANVEKALETMRNNAMLINERKRRMESIDKIAAWQRNVEDWEGPHLLETSSELIYSGELSKLGSNGWTQDRNFFLFDHQLIYCKKDLLKRDMYCYRGRIEMDHCEVVDVEDGKDSQFNLNVKNAWKLHDTSIDKWYLLFTKSPEEKIRWLGAFAEERKRVADDNDKGFVIPESARKAAMATTHNKQKKIHPEKPSEKGMSRKISIMPFPYQLEPLNDIPNHVTLPSGISKKQALQSEKKRNWSIFRRSTKR